MPSKTAGFIALERLVVKALDDIAGLMISPRIAERWFGPSTKRQRSSAYRAANAARDTRNWSLAAERFGALVVRWPLEAPAWVQLGHALKESGRLHEAEKAYVEGLRLKPDTVDTELHLFHLRRTLAATRQTPETGLTAMAAEEIAPAPAPAPPDVVQKRDNWAKAAQGYASIVAQDPANVPAWIQLGHAFKESGQTKQAEAAYREAIARHPGDPDAHLQLGHLHNLIGLRNEALQSYRQALALQPDLPQARGEIIRLGAAETGLSGLTMNTGEPVFVIRGDIISTTGYANAARALARLLLERYVVLGLSIHEDPADKSTPFPGHLVSQDNVIALAARTPVVVVHHTTPDNVIPIPLAKNVVSFYWETSAQPRRLQWAERLAFADAVWVPTSFVAEFVRTCFYTGPIMLVPWAHDLHAAKRSNAPRPRRLNQSVSYYESLVPGTAAHRVSLATLRNSTRTLCLAVQSVAPRKGLPLLLAGWSEHVAANPDRDDVLLLKLNFRHAHGIDHAGAAHLEKLLRNLGMANGRPLRLALLDATLTDEDMHRLFGDVDCYITATLGEGFGGPIVEALAARVPVIAPRHTGICDLLPDDDPFCIATTEQCVALVDNLGVYPHASTWHVPDRGAVAAALGQFVATPAAERQAILDRAVRHADAFCGMPAARARLTDALAPFASKAEHTAEHTVHA